MQDLKIDDDIFCKGYIYIYTKQYRTSFSKGIYKEEKFHINLCVDKISQLFIGKSYYY